MQQPVLEITEPVAEVAANDAPVVPTVPQGERMATAEELSKLGQVEATKSLDDLRASQQGILDKINDPTVYREERIKLLSQVRPEFFDDVMVSVTQMFNDVVNMMAGSDQSYMVTQILNLPAEIRERAEAIYIKELSDAKLANRMAYSYDYDALRFGYIFNYKEFKFVKAERNEATDALILESAQRIVGTMWNTGLNKVYEGNSHVATMLYVEAFKAIVQSGDTNVYYDNLIEYCISGSGQFSNAIYLLSSYTKGPAEPDYFITKLEQTPKDKNRYIFDVLFVVCSVYRMSLQPDQKEAAKALYQRLIAQAPYLANSPLITAILAV